MELEVVGSNPAKSESHTDSKLISVDNFLAAF